MVGGGIGNDGSAGLSGKNTIVSSDLDLTTIFVDPANGDYTPKGAAKGSGVYDSEVSTIMGSYPTDLLGNPRTVDGKIDMGCIQAQ